MTLNEVYIIKMSEQEGAGVLFQERQVLYMRKLHFACERERFGIEDF